MNIITVTFAEGFALFFGVEVVGGSHASTVHKPHASLIIRVVPVTRNEGKAPDVL